MKSTRGPNLDRAVEVPTARMGSNPGNTPPETGTRWRPPKVLQERLSSTCLGFYTLLPSQRPAQFISQEWQSLLTVRLLRAQRINSADPRLAGSGHPGYQLCPRVLSFRLLVAGEGGGGGLLLDFSGTSCSQREYHVQIEHLTSLLRPSRGHPQL